MKKTHNGILFFLIVSCLLFSACAPANEPFADGRKPQNHPVIGGYSYVDSMELAYATMFAVDYYEKDITLITIADNQRYLLLPDADESVKGMVQERLRSAGLITESDGTVV